MARLNYYLREHAEIGYAALIGLLFAVGGAVAGYEGHPFWMGCLAGVGTSLIAAAVVTALNPVNQESYQRFLSLGPNNLDAYQRFLALGIREIYPYRSSIPDDLWCKWLGMAKEKAILIGIALQKWCGDKNFPPTLRDRLLHMVEVKVFFLDQTKPVTAVRTAEEQRESGRNTEQMIRGSIQFMWKLRSELEQESRERFKLYVYNGTPSSGVTWIDSFMIATHYLSGSANVTSPALRLEPCQDVAGPDDLYSIYKENAQKLEKYSATPITDENVANYLPQQGHGQ